MKSVLVFKTSVTNRQEVKKLNPVLKKIVNKKGNWNFDLEDCDHILRVEALQSTATNIIQALQFEGYYCEELEG